MPAIKFRGVDFIDTISRGRTKNGWWCDSTRQFIEDNLILIIEECNRAGRFPLGLVRADGRHGFFGASLKGYGCAGMGERGVRPDDAGTGARRLRRAQFWSACSRGRACIRFTNSAAKNRNQTWLPPMQKGEKLGCFGLTEPDFGSNPGGMRTRAKKVGNEYVLNGEKMWITSGFHRLHGRLFGRRSRTRTTRFADSWSRPIGPASRPTTFTVSGRCARR